MKQENSLYRLMLLAVLLAAMPAVSGYAEQPIVTDSRIKTFVYNPNEVFSITTHYGYQSNIEFADRETIDTVSVGDRVAWQIIPAGQRLFIRAMEENAHTNMTVVTNHHAYQFDLRSSASNAVFGSAELTYVVRFFYPDSKNNGSIASADFQPSPVMAATPISYPAPMASAPPPGIAAAPMPIRSAMPTVSTPAPVVAAPATPRSYNYRYTYSGASDVAPSKIYDDGKTTYFRFRSAATPEISVITAQGQQLDVPVRSLPDNVVAVDIIAPSFSLKQSGQQVIVYNEAKGA